MMMVVTVMNMMVLVDCHGGGDGDDYLRCLDRFYHH